MKTTQKYYARSLVSRYCFCLRKTVSVIKSVKCITEQQQTSQLKWGGGVARTILFPAIFHDLWVDPGWPPSHTYQKLSRTIFSKVLDVWTKDHDHHHHRLLLLLLRHSDTTSGHRCATSKHKLEPSANKSKQCWSWKRCCLKQPKVFVRG